jgi:hypothetical protein
LVHIGYHKTGTSWLQKFLFRKPVGFRWGRKGPDTPIARLVAARSLEFDATLARADFRTELDASRERGLIPVVSLERLSGHPFSGGFDSKEMAERLASVFPEGRVLGVFREQRSMIVSTYKQYVRVGGACSLSRFIDPPRYRRPRMPLFDAQHFEYHHLLSRYRELFGAANVLFIPYELFLREPKEFVARIVDFAGLSTDPRELEGLPLDARPNRAAPALETALKRHVNRAFGLSDLNTNPLLTAPRLCQSLYPGAKWVASVAPGYLENRAEHRLRACVADWAVGRFADSNRVTAELTGFDLGAFGYDVAEDS